MAKKIIAVLLTLMMTFALLPVHVLATEFSDMPDNWSTTALEHAISNGLLNDENGLIRPDDNLTRAQMVAVINHLFNSTAMANLSGYSDVQEDKWYYDDMAKAVQMEILIGHNNKLYPDIRITREEVFVVLARAFKIPAGDQAVLNGFDDASVISSWAVDAACALIEEGYVNGYNGRIRPLSYITRAEFAQLLYNMAKVYISTEGTYTSISAGNVIINTPDVTLKDVNITGDLIIGDGVGDGDVTLENVNVSGRLIIRGGGLNSIKILGTSNMQNIVVARINGQVRVYTEEGIIIGEVVVDGKDDVLIEGSVNMVTILASNVTVTAKKSIIDDAVIEGDHSRLIVESDSTVSNLTVEAASTEIEVNGQITDVVVNKESAAISGSGGVKTVLANADNITVTTDDTLVTAAEGTAGVKAGTRDVSEGSTQNTTPNSTGTGTSSVTPKSYSISIDQTAINASNETAFSFTFSYAEVGADYTYSIDDTNGSTAAVTGSGIIATATDQVTSINVSSLDDDTLTLIVTITGQTDQTDTVIKDTTVPSGYSIGIDQSAVSSSNETALSFTFSSAEIGATYVYSIDDTNGGTSAVTGSGTIATATDQISNINVSSLGDGTLNLSVTLTDAAGNVGSAATDSVTKNATAPSGYSVSIDQSAVTAANEGSVSLTFASAEIGADYSYSIDDTNSSTSAVTGSGFISTATDQITGIDVSGLDDDTLTLTVYLTDSYGNQGGNATDTVTKDTSAPTAGNSGTLSTSGVGSSSATLNWTKASDTVSAEANLEYLVYYSTSNNIDTVSNMESNGTTVGSYTADINTKSVTGLTEGTLYYFNVIVKDEAGNKTVYTATSATTTDVTAPTAGNSGTLSTSGVGSTSVTLNWTKASDTVSAEANLEYLVYYSTSNNIDTVSNMESNGTVVGSYTADINTKSITGLTEGTLYYFNVIVKDEAGNKRAYTATSARPDGTAPSGYSVSIGQSKIISSNEEAMSFTFSGAEVDATYTYSIDDTDGTTSAVTGNGTINTATDEITDIDVSNLSDGTLTLSVTLTDLSSNTGTAVMDTVTKDTTAPTAGNSGTLSTSGVGSTSATLNWTKASDTVSAEANLEYLVYYSTSNNIDTVSNMESNGTVVGSYTADINTKSITGLTEGTLYYFNVIVKDEEGYKRAYTATSATTTDVTAPTAGNSGTLSTSGVGSTSVTLNWTKASDTVSAEANLEYLVYYSTSNNIDTVSNIESNGTVVGSYTADINTKSITGLTGGTLYYFNVIVKDEVGNKRAYTARSATTTAATVPNSYTGTSDASGNDFATTYTRDGDMNGKPKYNHYHSGYSANFTIFWQTNTNRWELHDDSANVGQTLVYYNTNTGDTPPLTGWVDHSNWGSLTLTAN